MYFRIISIVSVIVISFFFAENKAMGQSQDEAIEVKIVNLQGNTVFSDSELDTIISPVEGKTVTFDKLLQTRNAIEQYYIERGYISSGAFIPTQKLDDGIVTIRIIEGVLSRIKIKGRSGLSEKYIKSRLPKFDRPLNVNDLAQDLRKLRADPLIKEINGELKKIETGKNLLSVEIVESKPVQSKVNFANTFSSTVGNLGVQLQVKNQNLLGFGDSLAVDYTKTEGLDQYGVIYSLPINASGGNISFDYNNADSELIEEAISAFDIQADFESYQIVLRQPIINSDTQEAAFFLKLEQLRSESFVSNNISFPFVEGLENGVSRITPIRVGQEYVRRGQTNIFSAQSQFNVGLDVLDATNTELGIDGIFWSWQGNIQWIKSLNSKNLLLRTNLTAQFSPDTLLPLEQLTVGGVNSVRGYRQNLLVGDNGVLFLVQGQIPLSQQKWGNINLVPFVDFGTVWNNGSESRDSPNNTLASLGVELNYQLLEYLDARVFYGIPLIEMNDFGDTSTEERFGFSLSVIPLRF